MSKVEKPRVFDDFEVVSTDTFRFDVNNSKPCRLGDNLVSLNIDIDVYVSEGCTRIKLKDVPKFLVYAFNKISNNGGLDTDGIFRKEGNAARLSRPEVQSVYRGSCDIPEDFTIYDTCTMVKRFLRDLKPPLLDSSEFCEKLLDRAKSARVNDYYKLSHKEFDKLFSCSRPLSPVHLSTLSYIMRQLSRIAKNAEKHKMTEQNLALVLVNAVFGDDSLGLPSKKKGKERRGSQDDLLAQKRMDNDLRVAAVRLLISNANFIGLPAEHYVASSGGTLLQQRSNSAMPTMNREQQQSATLDSKASLRPPTMARRDSDAHVVTKLKKGENGVKKKRSQSFLPMFRDIKDRVSSQFLRRNKSPSPIRNKQVKKTSGSRSPARSSVESTSHGAKVFEDVESPQSPTERPLQRRISPTRKESKVGSMGSTSSGRQSRSQNSRRGNPNAVRRPTPGPEDNRPPTLDVPRLQDVQPLRRMSQSEQNSDKARMIRRKESDERRQALKIVDVFNGKSQLIMNSSKGDNVFVRPIAPNRVRRHTTPIKNGSLKRTQPVAVCKSLPQRRATMLGAHSDEKENIRDRPSIELNELQNTTTEIDDDTILDNTVDDLDNSTLILEQKGQESRSRRARRGNKRVTSSNASMIGLNGSVAAIIDHDDDEDDAIDSQLYKAPDSPPSKQLATCSAVEFEYLHATSSPRLPSTSTASKGMSTPPLRTQVETTKKATRFVDTATSPLVFAADQTQLHKTMATHGTAWVGSKQLISSSPQPPSKRQSRVSLTKTAEVLSGTPNSRLSVSPATTMRHVVQTNNSPALLIESQNMSKSLSTSRLSPLSKEYTTRSNRPSLDSVALPPSMLSSVSPPPPVPFHSPPPLTPQSAGLLKSPPAISSRPASPRLLSNATRPMLVAQHSLDSSRIVNVSPPAMSPLVIRKSSREAPVHPEDNVFKLPTLPARTTSKAPISSSRLQAEVNKKMTIQRDEFGFENSHLYTQMILSSTNTDSILASLGPTTRNAHPIVDQRPSIVAIREHSGLVRQRVNQFQEIAEKHTDSYLQAGRASAMSIASVRSSDRETLSSDDATMLGSRSSVGSTVFDFSTVTSSTATRSHLSPNAVTARRF